MIIDSHVHLWHQDSDRYPNRPWLQGDLPPLDGTGDRLIELMDQAGVNAALNVQVPWYGEDNRYHRDVAARHPGRFALLGVLDPAVPEAPERLDRQVREEAVQGLRIHFNEPDRIDQVRNGTCDPVIGLAGELGVPVQCLARMHDLDVIGQAAARFPRTNFVIDHLGHPDLSEPPPFPSARGFFDLGSLPNVYVKVSLLCDHSRCDYPYGDVQDYVRETLETIGAGRMMWGSNYPLIPEVRTEQPVDYGRSLALVRDEWDWLSAGDRELILGGTAESLWNFS